MKRIYVLNTFFIFVVLFFAISAHATYYRVKAIDSSRCPSFCGFSDGVVTSNISCGVSEVPNVCSSSRNDKTGAHNFRIINNSVYFNADGSGEKYSLPFILTPVESCPDGTEDVGGDCKENTCEAGYVYDQSQTWSWTDGSQATVCLNSCTAKSFNSVCSDIEYTCTASFKSTGSMCNFSGIQYSGSTASPDDDLPDDDIPDGDNGGGDGGTSSGGGSGGDSGGGDTGGGDTGGGDTGGGSNSDTPYDDSALRAAVNNVASKVTQASQANVSAVDGLKDSVDDSVDEISSLNESTQKSLSDTNEALAGIDSKVSDLSDAVSSAGDNLSDIAANSDALANKDVQEALDGNCIADSSYSYCDGWYKSEYKDGLSGIFDSHIDNISSQAQTMIDNSFGNLDISNASAPSFCLKVMEYGSYCIDDYIDLNFVFSFLRFAFIFTTVMYCRKMIFGG